MPPAEPARLGANRYRDTLAAYLDRRSEAELYEASLLSEELVRDGLGPDEIVALHLEALELLTGREGANAMQRVRALDDAHQFLLEVMIAYGVHYKQHVDMIVEERERGRAEAARVERDRASLLASIAHEFATPLTVAVGHTRRAGRALDRGQHEDAREAIADSAVALERLSRLLSDLRYASQRGELPELELGPCHLTEVVGEVCSWVTEDARLRSIRLHVEDGLRAPVIGEAEAIKTVLGNLVSNAVRYTPAGGEVTIATVLDGDQAYVEVRDTGIGIEHDILGQIFEPFYRSDGARSASAKGLGLGLAISRQLAEALQGRLEVDSSPGTGSTFRLVLPLHREENGRDAR